MANNVAGGYSAGFAGSSGSKAGTWEFFTGTMTTGDTVEFTGDVLTDTFVVASSDAGQDITITRQPGGNTKRIAVAFSNGGTPNVNVCAFFGNRGVL